MAAVDPADGTRSRRAGARQSGACDCNRAGYAHTLANIAAAVQRGISVQAGIVDVLLGQDVQGARDQLQVLGVSDINTDRARPVGRAAPAGYQPTPADLCGNCGRGRAAILGTGELVPCVLGRFLVAGDVRTTPLADLLAGEAFAELAASVPARTICGTCTPADGNDCDPSRTPWTPDED